MGLWECSTWDFRRTGVKAKLRSQCRRISFLIRLGLITTRQWSGSSSWKKDGGSFFLNKNGTEKQMQQVTFIYVFLSIFSQKYGLNFILQTYIEVVWSAEMVVVVGIFIEACQVHPIALYLYILCFTSTSIIWLH